MDFTVAIPTYNGEHRLPELLERLRSQSNPANLQWEILIVDNNSSDRTPEVVQSFQAHFPVAIRHLKEPCQGAGYARHTAIRSAQSDLVGLLDDDNLPDETWLSAAYDFAQVHVQAGAYGSQIRGEFEVNPSENLRRILPFLAITERGEQPTCYIRSQGLLPPTAGLVVRKQVWLDYVPEAGILMKLGFKRSDGNHCGEDIEALGYIHRSPWEIWYNPAMKITHKIPAWRLERSYLLPLFRSIGLSRYVTRMLKIQPWKRSLMVMLYIANDFRKSVLHYLKYRSQLQTDLAAACEMELFLGSLLSPFHLWQAYFWQKSIRKKSGL
ncbi:MAG: hormogonium polysaccharide biosynthesis glycosyltransferase HpsE [Drouetiella hepatica Uher 2000/2452]|uniref:Hormogonium polysaccharide biosynthesis glycosyltransferase HpsE n=1 Tax=Drouetiella hepatica Uher 2000/2452 TaxID=904376 RepID=A0A951Q8Y0_9CYAN|nr:hormogonium polysaccharide biosynthesis glycosyltransferase HpsE [Drouetiella hepatica Uher 2000/2452]